MNAVSRRAIRRLRGRPVAAIALGFAVLMLLGAVAIMGSLLLPQGVDAIRAIWFVSLAVLVAGLAVALRDIVWLRREWAALATLDHGDALSRYEEYREPNRPLIAERAEEVRRLKDNPDSSSPGDLRANLRREAVAASAPIGSVTRFLSSALLLLAVIGTFAGMKAALPDLIQQIQQAGERANGNGHTQHSAEQPSQGAPSLTVPAVGQEGLPPGPTRSVQQDDSFLKIGAALSPVADAFGANFLALLGSLALGLVAFGGLSERSRLLHQLDRVSERRLYPHIPVGASADRLAHAVQEMKQNVTAVTKVGEGIKDLQVSIGAFQGTLKEAIDGLRSSFAHTIQQQSNELQGQLNQTIGQVVVSMQDISRALSTTAVSYEGLVVGLRERDLNVQKASETLQRIGEQLSGSMAEASASLVQAGKDVATTQQTVAAQAAHTEAAVTEATAALKAAGSAIAEGLERHNALLEPLPTRFEAAVHQQGEVITAALATNSEQTGERLGEILDSVREGTVKLEAIAERETAIRGEIVGMTDIVRAGFRDTQTSWSTLLESHLSAVQAQLNGIREQITTSMAQGSQAEEASASETRQVILAGFADVRGSIEALEQSLVAAIQQNALPQEPVLASLLQVGHNTSAMQQNGLAIQQGTSAVQTELSALKNLVQSVMQQYQTKAEERSTDVSVLGSR